MVFGVSNRCNIGSVFGVLKAGTYILVLGVINYSPTVYQWPIMNGPSNVT